MAFADFPNKAGAELVLYSDRLILTSLSITGTILDAAGESRTYIGQVRLEGGSGSKTISAAGGGQIHWLAGNTVTFANAGTNLRVGIQDIGATGIEDGTFDVYGDLTGGTDTINSGVMNVTAMTSGTKTLAHGDLIGVSHEMTTKGGADRVDIGRYGSIVKARNFPYRTEDSGSGPSKQTTSQNPTLVIEFDDGTIGWIDYTVFGNLSEIAFDVADTPDEYAVIFQVPFPCTLSGVNVLLGSIGSSDDFEVIVYSDPLGTPNPERTIVVDPNLSGSSAADNPYLIRWSPFDLAATTDYAISVRPTTTGALSISLNDLDTGGEKLRRLMPLGENTRLGTRTDNSGAFTEDDTMVPLMSIIIGALDDGAGGAGGTRVYVSG